MLNERWTVLPQYRPVRVEVPDDLVRDMTEILTCFCARLYGKRSAANRAKRAVEAVGG